MTFRDLIVALLLAPEVTAAFKRACARAEAGKPSFTETEKADFQVLHEQAQAVADALIALSGAAKVDRQTAWAADKAAIAAEVKP